MTKQVITQNFDKLVSNCFDKMTHKSSICSSAGSTRGMFPIDETRKIYLVI